MSDRPAMGELPDPFVFANGEPVRSRADWERRRVELRDLLLQIEYGPLPPVTAPTRGELLHTSRARRFREVRHEQYRLTADAAAPISFLLDVMWPDGGGPWPVVLTGDGCWRYLTDDIRRDVLGRGYALAEFNRVEIYADVAGEAAVRSAAQLYPSGRGGALSAWAWGYHRCVDFLQSLSCVDGSRIAIVGHSRGGKTTLLAGSTDERIALVGANGSGCGGAGCFRRQGMGSETLEYMLQRFAFWFAPDLERFINRENELPVDQHFLKALLAPRPLLTTEAHGDLWANPAGTWQTHLAAREVYRALGAEERIGISYREGGHDHTAADWSAFLDFADHHLRGLPVSPRFDVDPYPDDPPAFTWRTPSLERGLE